MFPLAIIDKFREAANVSKVMNVIGDVSGRDCLMIDDIIDTAGTLEKGSKALIDKGAQSVNAAATHGLFSTDKEGISAYTRLEKSYIDQVIVMDTIPQNNEANKYPGLIHTLSVAPIFAKAIKAIQNNDSISNLFV